MTSRARAAAALSAILAIVIGLPMLLTAIGAGPVPAVFASWSRLRLALTAPDDGTVLLALMQVLAWLSWAVLTGLVAVEIGSRRRGIPAPHLPALSAPQGLIRTLVSTAAVLFLLTQPAEAAEHHRPPAVTAVDLPSAPAGVPADTLVGAAVGASTATGGTTPGAATAHDAATREPGTSPAPARVPASTVDHVVRPGETLWTIAERYLGDGARFDEIAALNYGRRQPDGQALDDSHWIIPGWHLVVPDQQVPDVEPRQVEVEPGQNLWDIAEATLGSGAAWPEIFEASRDRDQPDGSRLEDPDLLHPGWQLTVPEPGDPGDTAPQATEPAATDPGAADPTSPDGATGATPHRATPEAPDGPPAPEGTPAAESTPAAVPTGAAVTHPADPQAGPTAADDLDELSPWTARTTGGVGALLAAGVVTTLGARRRAQTLRRTPGEPPPSPPPPQVATTEQNLRAVADPLGVHTIDLVLRTLARHCAHVGMTLPTVRAARLDRTHVELYLAAPAAMPEPWTTPSGSIEATVWRLVPDEAPIVGAEELADIPAPYPALVTLGHDANDAHVLVDLEHLGHLAITGSAERAQAALSAMVLELATSQWADDVQLTVVGDFAAVEDVIATGRIRYLPTLGRAVEDLAARSRSDRAALLDAGVGDPGSARIRRLAPQTWTPEILVVAAPLTAEQREELRHCVTAQPRTAHAVITLGSAPGNWTLEIPEGSGPAVLAPIGMVLRPQALDEQTRGHIVELIARAEPQQPGPRDGPAAPPRIREPALGELASIAPPDREPDAAAPIPPTGHPMVRLLGPVVVDGARGSVEPSKRGRLTELVAYLALHPGSGHRQIDEALWPGRRHEDNLNTRNTATSKARSWLGRSADGEEYLPRHAAGTGYRLAASVTTDWDHWLELVGGGAHTTSTEALQQALTLVRGRPFDGVHPKRYGWADGLRQRMTHQIVDVAYELARRWLAEGHWRSAEAALATGLMVEPAWEPLWRLRIMAAYEAHNPVALEEAIARLLAVTDALGADLEPMTLELLDAVRRR